MNNNYRNFMQCDLHIMNLYTHAFDKGNALLQIGQVFPDTASISTINSRNINFNWHGLPIPVACCG